MSIVYQLTALLTISLIVLIIIVFIMGVTLAGRTVLYSMEQKKKIKEQNKKSIQKKREELEKKFSECTDLIEIRKLQEEIKKTTENLQKVDKQIKKIKESPNVLTVKGGVLKPGAILISSLTCSFFASALSDYASIRGSFWTTILPLFIWIIGIALLYVVICSIISTLEIIHEAITLSDETTFKAAMVRTETSAMGNHEEDEKPVLELEIISPKLPIIMSIGTTQVFEFVLSLRQGDLAKNSEIIFAAKPNTLEFPERKDICYQSTESPMAGYLSTKIQFGDIKKGMRLPFCLMIKAPNKIGEFMLSYRICCDGFAGEPKEIFIVVPK